MAEGARMFNSVLVDIGIGVAVVFFVVASMVAALNEIVTRTLDIRAKVLWKALGNGLDREQGGLPFQLTLGDALRFFRGPGRDLRPVVEPAGVDLAGAGGRLTERLANTSLVRTLAATAPRSKGRTKVDYIAGDVFAAALLEITQQASGEVLAQIGQARTALRAGRVGARPTDVVAGWDEARTPGAVAEALARAGIDPELGQPLARAAAAFAEAARSPQVLSPVTAAGLVGQLEAALAQLTAALYPDQLTELRLLLRHTPAGAAVEAAVARAGGDAAQALTEAVAAVEAWFNQQMATLSEHYKKAARKVLLVAGLILAVVANISAFDLVHDLRDDAQGRELLVSAVTSACPVGAGQQACLDGLSTGIGAGDASVTLPLIGTWVAPWRAVGLGPDAPGGPWWQAVLGWAVTGLAVSFGAPFWFDVLKRLGSYRRSG